MLQGTHAVTQPKNRQVPDFRRYRRAVNAPVPLVVDLISNAQMIEACGEGCCNDLQDKTECALAANLAESLWGSNIGSTL